MTNKKEKALPDFKIKAYSKSELALCYFPDATSPHTAVNHLMSWVRQCPGLMAELQKLGTKKAAKYFTPKEVALIVKYLGEP